MQSVQNYSSSDKGPDLDQRIERKLRLHQLHHLPKVVQVLTSLCLSVKGKVKYNSSNDVENKFRRSLFHRKHFSSFGIVVQGVSKDQGFLSHHRNQVFDVGWSKRRCHSIMKHLPKFAISSRNVVAAHD